MNLTQFLKISLEQQNIQHEKNWLFVIQPLWAIGVSMTSHVPSLNCKSIVSLEIHFILCIKLFFISIALFPISISHKLSLFARAGLSYPILSLFSLPTNPIFISCLFFRFPSILLFYRSHAALLSFVVLCVIFSKKEHGNMFSFGLK